MTKKLANVTSNAKMGDRNCEPMSVAKPHHAALIGNVMSQR